MQKASSVAQVAFDLLKNNENITDYKNLEPFYLKKTQAEREYEEKNL